MGEKKKTCGETGVEMTIMFNMTRDIPFYPPTSLQKPISHKQTNRNLVLPSADMCRTMGVHAAFCYTCFESNLDYSVKVKGARSLTRLHFPGMHHALYKEVII